MVDAGSSLYEIFTYAAGVAGNLFAFVLFVSPLPTFRRIFRNKSTEQFSGLPYVYSLLNCLIVLWYGLPWVSQGVILVVTVNSVGALFHLSYVTIFIVFSENWKKFKMLGLLLGVFCIFALVIYVTLEFFHGYARQDFVGYLSVASLISMCASPLFIILDSPFSLTKRGWSSNHAYGVFLVANTTPIVFIYQNLVIRTKSVEFMPFYLSLSTFLMSISFFTYGLFLHDFYIYLPNGIGAVLGLVQLLLYAYYSRKSSNTSRLPLLVSG